MPTLAEANLERVAEEVLSMPSDNKTDVGADGSNGNNGSKKTLTLLLEQSITAQEQISVSQMKVAEAITENTSAINKNTREISGMSQALTQHITEEEALYKKTLGSLDNLPSTIESIVAKEIQNVPSNSWSWMFEKAGKVGSTGGGFVLVIALVYFAIKFVIAGAP